MKEISSDGTRGTINWINNWTVHMDTMVQSPIVEIIGLSCFVPKRIERLSIDPIIHMDMSKQKNGKIDEILLELSHCPIKKFIRCGGVEILNYETSILNRRRQKKAISNWHSRILQLLSI